MLLSDLISVVGIHMHWKYKNIELNCCDFQF